MDATIKDIIGLVQNVGLPAVLLIGGGLFFTRRAWPDLVQLVRVYAEALCRLADAVELLAERIPPLPSSDNHTGVK